MSGVTCKKCGARFSTPDEQFSALGVCPTCVRAEMNLFRSPAESTSACPTPWLKLAGGAGTLAAPPVATASPPTVARPPSPVASTPPPRPPLAAPLPVGHNGSAAKPTIRTDTEPELNPFQRWIKLNLSVLSSAALHLTLVVVLGLFYVARQERPRLELVAYEDQNAEYIEPEAIAPVAVDLPEESLTPLPAQADNLAAFASADLPDTMISLPALDPTAQLLASNQSLDSLGQGQGSGFEDGTGTLGMLSKRLQKAGAKTGDVQISLFWNNLNDLDLHVRSPTGEVIFYRHRRARDGGMLDVDMNALLFTKEPVENIFWPTGRAPKGEYVVMVDYFANHGDPDPTTFGVAVKVDGEVKTFDGKISRGQPPVVIYKFTRR